AARGAGERNAHGAATRGEGGSERADLDAGGERRVAQQRVGGGKRQSVHRSARHQPVALRAIAAAILHGACGTDRSDDKLAHAATSSAMISPASAARSCSAKVLASTG